MTGETCHQCGADAVRTLGAFPYCHTCAETILEPIRNRQFVDEGGIGWGRQAGPMRPDWGPTFADLCCTVCQATWTGPVGEQCGFCIRTRELLVDAHRRAMLRPDRWSDDPARAHRQQLDWAERLGRGVRAGLITRQEAESAMNREVRRVS